MNRRILLLLLAMPLSTLAAEPGPVLVIKDHRFLPAELRVPAGQKIRLTIDNQDQGPEEFESHELNREKIVPGRSKGIVFIGPLKPGRYAFFGEFNPKTAQGVIVAE
jgi:hypothetical protein